MIENSIQITSKATAGTAGRKPKWAEDMLDWTVTLQAGERKMRLYFYTGRGLKRKPDTCDVMYSLRADYGYKDMHFDEFCRELGYDMDDGESTRTYKAAIKQAEQLEVFLGAALAPIYEAYFEDGEDALKLFCINNNYKPWR